MDAVFVLQVCLLCCGVWRVAPQHNERSADIVPHEAKKRQNDTRMPSCTLTGGRHLRTYGGRSLDVPMGGGCRYVLSQGCGAGEEPDDTVAVHIQQGGVYLQLLGLNLTLEEKGGVMINNSSWRLPFFLEKVVVYRSGLVTRVALHSGVVVTYGGPDLLRIALPAWHRAQCGLCGTMNLTDGTHTSSNDTTHHPVSDEDNRDDVSSFLSRWSVSPSGSNCCHGGAGCSSHQGCNSTRAARFRSAQFCGALSSPVGPFAGCHSAVDPWPFLEACVSDLCGSRDQDAAAEEAGLCGALRAYAFSCQEEGGELLPWRRDACHVSCPAYSHYSPCASSCPESCTSMADVAGVACPWPCAEGCQCDPGYMQSSDSCVRLHDCGCLCKGRYYEKGETMEGCSVPCNNTDPATWLCCEGAPCPEGRNCTSMSLVKGGTPASSNQEALQARRLCTLSGGRHVTTFGGRERRLRGRGCRYHLMGVCDGPQRGPPPAEVHALTGGHGQSALSVSVKMGGVLLEMDSNNTHSIQVDGLNSSLPYSLNPTVTVYSTCHSTVINDTELGFILSLSTSGLLSILPGEHSSTSCGLCTDDAPLPPGRLAEEAWRSEDDPWRSENDPWCIHDVTCPANSHYEYCGSSCPLSCVVNVTSCQETCVQGCFCDHGFVRGLEGCVRPEQCGCTDPTGRYHPNTAPFWITEDCRQLCHCDPDTSRPRCEPHLCPRGQVCKQLGKERACRPGEPLNCTYVNGMHLSTFDGRWFEFRDSCVYTLVASSSNRTEPELTAFNVTISDASCAKRFSHGLDLTLWVGGLQVLVGKDHPDKILVDGLHAPLPFYHQTGLVKADHAPSSLIIQTHFGLQLTVYTTGSIMVELPDMYRSSVAGLCGNANGDPLDDLLMPGGELAASVSEFTRSWRSGGAEKSCATDCVSKQKNCSEEQLEFFRGDDFCGVLLNELGPLEECASVLSPQPYMEMCARDSCLYGGHSSALCSSIAAYTAACQAAQLPVRHWRSDTFCAMSCPMNSQYELCWSDCRPACVGGQYNQSACSGRWQEGCVCDKDFVLSDGHCVAKSDCGCLYHGWYYPAGDFYPGHSCHKCHCLGGEVNCTAAPCGHQENCRVVDGVARCRPLEYRVCQVFAGFSYLTFDGRAFAHRGAECTYVLSERSSRGQEDSEYTVLLSFQTDRNPDRNTTVQKISRLELRLNSLMLTVDPQTPWKIQVNMEDRMLPLDIGPIRAFYNGNSVFISSVRGVSLQLSSTQYLRLSVPLADGAVPSGLCGDLNWDPSDDLRLRSGHLTDDPAEFQHSWAVAAASGQQCNDSCSRTACGEPCTAPPEAMMRCDILVARSVLFQRCWDSQVEALFYRDVCLQALCAGAGSMEATCLALEGYATACQEAGFTVGAWRENTTCSLQCPEGSSARQCVDASVSSCPALLQPGSAARGRVCHEGCQCHGDSVMDGDQCVAHMECGCLHQGRYIKVDEEVYTEHCAQRCWCHPLGGALCQPAPCQPWERCALINGSWACHQQPPYSSAKGETIEGCSVPCNTDPTDPCCEGAPCPQGRNCTLWNTSMSSVKNVTCPANSHYEFCGSSCPPSCVVNVTSCQQTCVQGCFCDHGFVHSPEGCVRPEQCGCTDSAGRYHPNTAPFWIPEECGQLCVCHPGTGRARCEPSRCPRGQVCKQLGKERACRPGEPLNCTYVNGMYLSTFDGRRFEFRDSCVYTLVASGSNQTEPELTAFNMTISDASCAKRFSHSLDLTLWVGGLQVLVGKDHPDKILVDGLHAPLPFYHQTGLVKAYHAPSSLVIQTHFGLQLTVYTTGSIMVELPHMYRSSVSGLCGNANGNPLDDFLMPGGELAASASEFTRSWRSGGAEKSCATDCVSKQKNCSEEQLEFFRGDDFCGVLLNELGPLEECASVLSPQPYMEMCARDSCLYGGHSSALCSSIAAYTAACQAAQLPVRHWRSDTFCAMSCPMNSHYELCGSDCRSTCAGVLSDKPAACSEQCQEGCQCDEGFVLSDGHCVALLDCGCLYHGRYYPAGDFYPCHSCLKCHCLGGEVNCTAASCGHQESCTVVDGVARCRPQEYGVCQVFAGFSYLTFDGRAFAHRGAECTYVLSEHSSRGREDSEYTVLLSFQTDRNPDRNTTVQEISRLELRLNSLMLTVDPQTPWKIQVNMEDRTLPLDIGPIRAFYNGNSVFISSVRGVSLQLSSTQYLRLSVPLAYGAVPSGLCGDFNWDPSDDLRLRSGRLTDDPAEFQHSWSVAAASGQQCNDSCSGTACGEPCTAPPEAMMRCDILVARSVLFQRCWDSQVEALFYRDVCLQALCAGAGSMEATCLALEGYATACQEAGFTVGAWRENTTCSLQCPEGSSARQCVDASVSSCPALLQPGSAARGRVCYEGCQCDGDSVIDGDQCVAHMECGCLHQGRYIKVDEEVYTKHCAQRCWCHPLGGALCQSASCSPWEQCALLNGSWACHRPHPQACQLHHGLHVTTLAGHMVELPDLQMYPYNIASLCDQTSRHWFSVVSFHGRCGGSTTSRTVNVLQVLFQGASVAIQEGAVKVNGHPVSLPHTLASVGVSLSAGVALDGSEVTVALRRGSPGSLAELEVEVGVAAVTVRLPVGYLGGLCGVCGDPGHAPFPSQQPITSWVLPDVPACGFNK